MVSTHQFLRSMLLLAVFGLFVPRATAYGPLTHAVVVYRQSDAILKTMANWCTVRGTRCTFSPAERKRIIAAAVAGAMLHDAGYVNEQLFAFTNLLHYQGTGRFVDELLAQSVMNGTERETIAFALGALSHYDADRMGHFWATNRASATLLMVTDRVGPRLSYEDNPVCHGCIEQAFDRFTAADLPTSELPDFLDVLDTVAQMVVDFPGGITKTLDLVMVTAYGLDRKAFSPDEEFYYWFPKMVVPAYAQLLQKMRVAIESARASYGTTIDFTTYRDLDRVTKGVVAIEKHNCKPILSTFDKDPIMRTWFDTSLRKAGDLYHASLLSINRTPRRLADGNWSMWPSGEAPPNINLDTNRISGAGDYDLADVSFAFLTDHSDRARNGQLAFVADYKTLSHRNRYFSRLKLVDQTAITRAVSDVDSEERQADQITFSEATSGWPLAPPLPVFVGQGDARCNDSDLKTTSLGSGSVLRVGKMIVCAPSTAGAFELWLGALAASQLKAGPASPSGSPPTDLASNFLQTAYDYGLRDENFHNYLKSRCNVLLGEDSADRN